ncbi:MAG: phage terminase large subunit family protein, partial [Proteobacteria bacterium]|nr:phage terminase large subunit family protein [Pseudomonadota bacterium]
MQLTPPNRKIYRPRKGFPFFLPKSVVERGEHTTAFSMAERRAMRKKRFKKPSEWAPLNRKIVKGDLAGNYMNMEVTPHLRGIMDAAVLPFIREIGIIAAPQTAKTTGVDTIIAWTRVFAKGPACSFYPDETTGTRSMKTRIRPMVEQSPALRREVVSGKDSYTKTGI